MTFCDMPFKGCVYTVRTFMKRGSISLLILLFQRCIVMRQFYFSYKKVKHVYSLSRAYAVICGRFNITVNWDYLHAQNQGKLATVCLQRFSSIFERTIALCQIINKTWFTFLMPRSHIHGLDAGLATDTIRHHSRQSVLVRSFPYCIRNHT